MVFGHNPHRISADPDSQNLNILPLALGMLHLPAYPRLSLALEILHAARLSTAFKSLIGGELWFLIHILWRLNIFKRHKYIIMTPRKKLGAITNYYDF